MSNLFTATTASEVEECLDRGDNLEEERAIDWELETPLISSIKRRNKEVFLSLLEHKADPNHNPPGFKKPIQVAASEGWRDMVEALVKAGADLNENEKEVGLETPLHLAAENGAVDVTEGLLALGANTEVKNSLQRTPLMVACEMGHEDVVDRLLAAGADVKTQDCFENSALILASRNGHLGIVDRLVIHGANINHQTKKRTTPLIEATYQDHTAIVDRLVGLGCDLNIQVNDQYGTTALMTACLEGFVEIVKILLAHGADTQIEDNNGETAIDYSQSREIKDLLKSDL